MRTALIAVPWLGARGGAERYAAEVAAALSSVGWRVVLATRDATSIPGDAEYFGVNLTGVEGLDLPQATRGRLPRAVDHISVSRHQVATLADIDADLFINTGFRSELPGVGRRNVYLCHFPHVLYATYTPWPRALYMRSLEYVGRHLVNGGADFRDTYDVFVANSRYTQSHMLIRWGVDAHILEPPCPDFGPGASAREKVILNVGRFEAKESGVSHKGQDLLVSVFAGMHDLHEQGWELHLAGSATGRTSKPFLDSLRSQAAGLPVYFHPNASFEQLRWMYRSSSLYWHAQGWDSDALSHPETQEHFGMTTVEAMSAGLIPIVIATAGPQEVVEPVHGVGLWRDARNLASETRRITALGPIEQEDLRRRCVERAQAFASGAFRGRLLGLVDEVMADRPQVPPN